MKSYHVVGFLILLIAFLYLPFLGNAFVSDDIQGIVQQVPTWTLLRAMGWPYILRLDGLFRYVIFQLFGLTPWAFRLFNILAHAGSVVLVYAIVQRITQRQVATCIAAVLFAIHPLVIESVTWISGGVYTIYSFFFLLSFSLYISASKKPMLYVLSLLSFFLSLSTSEKAISLALVFVAYEWFFGNLKKQWKKLIPYVLLSSGLIVFYALKIGERTQALTIGMSQSFSGLQNPFVQIPIAISSYLSLFVFPVGLTLYHSELTFSWLNFAGRAFLTLAAGGWMVYTFLKRKPIGFWLFWFVIALLPTLTPFKIAWIVAERYVYLSLVGLSVVVGIWFDTLLHIKRLYVPTVCIGFLVCLTLCTQTVRRNAEWRTEDSLWIATAKTSPSNPVTWNNMGDVYGRHGEYEKSIEAFTRATQINPNYADAYHNIGNTYVHMKKYQEAIPFFEKALSINPSLWESYQDLAFIAVANKKYDKAIGLFEKAVAINPQDAVLWTNIGVVYLEVGEQDKARYAMEQAIALDPSDPHARNLQKRLQETH